MRHKMPSLCYDWEENYCHKYTREVEVDFIMCKIEFGRHLSKQMHSHTHTLPFSDFQSYSKIQLFKMCYMKMYLILVVHFYKTDFYVVEDTLIKQCTVQVKLFS